VEARTFKNRVTLGEPENEYGVTGVRIAASVNQSHESKQQLIYLAS
jgi:hypothetical protein